MRGKNGCEARIPSLFNSGKGSSAMLMRVLLGGIFLIVAITVFTAGGDTIEKASTDQNQTTLLDTDTELNLGDTSNNTRVQGTGTGANVTISAGNTAGSYIADVISCDGTCDLTSIATVAQNVTASNTISFTIETSRSESFSEIRETQTGTITANGTTTTTATVGNAPNVRIEYFLAGSSQGPQIDSVQYNVDDVPSTSSATQNLVALSAVVLTAGILIFAIRIFL